MEKDKLFLYFIITGLASLVYAIFPEVVNPEFLRGLFVGVFSTMLAFLGLTILSDWFHGTL